MINKHLELILFNHILPKCNFYTELSMKLVNKQFYDNVVITELPYKIEKNIKNEGLKYLSHLTYLSLKWNKKITDDGIKNFITIKNIKSYK